MAIKKLAETLSNLAGSITVSDRRARFSPTIRRMAEECRASSDLMAKVGARYPREPYRIILSSLRERLMEQAEASLTEPADPKAAPLTAADVRDTLAAVEADLRRGPAAPLAEGELKDAISAVDVFGLGMARLDLRQHSAWHAKAVAAVLERPDYEQLSETEK